MKKTIQKLGGLKRIEKEGESKDIRFFHTLNLPGSVLYLLREYNGLAFIKDVRIKGIDVSGYIEKNDAIMVDYFCEKKNILFLEGMIPKGFIPFCEGVAGDYFCVSVCSDDYGSIHYWYHENLTEGITYPVSPDLNSFLARLFIYKEESVDTPGVTVTATYSAEFLEMVRKYKKKKGI